MSTSCAIRFTDGDQRAQLYRDRHGNPENVISNLEHLRKTLIATRSYRDPGYTAAQFVFVDKIFYFILSFRDGRSIEAEVARLIDVLEPRRWKDRPTPEYFLGHLVEDPVKGIRGHEDYLYLVELPADEEDDWRLKVSGREQFPLRNEEESERVFETIEWMFEGPLEEAFTKLEER